MISGRYHRNAAAAALSIVGGALWGLSIQVWIGADWSMAAGFAAGALVGTWAIRSALGELESSQVLVVAIVGILVLSGLVRLYEGSGWDARVAAQVSAGAGGAAVGAWLGRRWTLWCARVLVAGMIATPIVTGLMALGLTWKTGVPIWYLIWGGSFLGGAITAALVPNMTPRQVGIGQGLWFGAIVAAWFYDHLTSDKIVGEALRAFGAAWIGSAGAKAVIRYLQRKPDTVEVPPARATGSDRSVE